MLVAMRHVALLVGLLLAGTAAAAGLGETVSYKWDRSKEAWREGSWDGYVTGYAWHAPYAYSKQKRDEYNDFAAGGGLGRSVLDDDGDKHSLYALVFRDSHYKPQYTAGYAWMRYGGGGTSGLSFGYGYTVYMFARSDVNHYLPAPMAGLLASARYGRFELMVVAVPIGKADSGNIALLFGRWSFK
jgi:lipid IVA palmitoyltransferase